MTPTPLTVAKVGGSLAADAGRLRAVLVRLAAGSDGPVVLVPGGGVFADAVRSAQASLAFDDRLAHGLALEAMARMAEVFCALEPRLALASSLEVVRGLLAEGRVPVWDPVALRAGAPDVAESWAVTSDSLALWLARRLDAGRCLLVKSISAPAGASARRLAELDIVDRAFLDVVAEFAGEIVLRGPQGDVRVLPESSMPLSSHPHPHPEVRGAAEPRRSPPEGAAGTGSLLRGCFVAPQDEGKGGFGRAADRDAVA